MAKNASSIEWPVLHPFVISKTAAQNEIDEFGHVNNLVYITWALDAAWAHSNHLGLSIDVYKKIGIGCVVWHHEFDYLNPIFEGEDVLVATWIAENDGRLRMTRKFEMKNPSTGNIYFKGQTLFVSIDMDSGKPARMPQQFVDAYCPAKPN